MVSGNVNVKVEPAPSSLFTQIFPQGDVLLGVLGLEEQHLRDHQVREVVLDERRQKDDPLPQQSREDVERVLTSGRLLHDHRN